MLAVERKPSFRLALRKELGTHHFPVTVAEGLDRLLAPSGYQRQSQNTQSEAFIWQNKRNERFIVDYYTQVNGIAHSRRFDAQRDMPKEQMVTEIDELYGTLRATIGALNLHLGDPYVSATRSLFLEIEGENPQAKANLFIPVVKDLYLQQEQIPVVRVETLDHTQRSIQVMFDPIGLPE